MRWRLELHKQSQTGPILRREGAWKLLKRAQKPLNQEVQVCGKVILQEVHLLNQARRPTNFNFHHLSRETTLEAKELPIERIDSGGTCLFILDGGVCAVEERCQEGVSRWGDWSQTYTVEQAVYWGQN